MFEVGITDVGVGGFARLRADAAILETAVGQGLAADVEPSPALRARAYASAVPTSAALAGLTACWVHGLSPRPGVHVLVAVRRGARPGPAPGWAAARWSFVTEPQAFARAASCGGVAVVTPADAVATALRLSDLGASVGAAWRAAHDADLVRGVSAALERAPGHAAGIGRGRAAWDCVLRAAAATGARGDARR